MSSKSYALYYLGTGEILQMMDLPASLVAQNNPDTNVYGMLECVANDAIHYISEGQVVDRPQLNAPDTTMIAAGEYSTVLGVPEGTEVFVNNSLVGVIDDGAFGFTCDVPGKYQIRVEPPFPYIPIMYEVTVNAT